MRNTIQRHYLFTFLLSIIFVTAACIDEGQIVRNCNVTTPNLYNPVIIEHPTSDTINEGKTATLKVVATAPRGATLTYQWQKATRGSTDFTDIADATATSYTTPVLIPADSGTQYRVVVTATNTAKRMINSTISNEAMLSVLTSAFIVWTHIDGTRRYADVPADGTLLSSTLTDTITNIQSVDTIPSSITTIGKYAFYGCDALTSIGSMNQITIIGNYAFYGCKALTSISSMNQVTVIGNYAFYGCKALTSINSLSKVTIIGAGAFYDCIALTSINSLSSVITIEEKAFATCKALTSISTLSSVTTIGSYAFSGCKALTSISSLRKVTSIGNDAFSGCGALTNVDTLSSIITIGSYAFWNCTSLANISMPNCIIEQAAFQGCSSLTNISIPNSITSIGQWAFRLCEALTYVKVEATKPPRGVDDMFDKTHATLSIAVPSASVAAYKAAEGWSKYADRIIGY